MSKVYLDGNLVDSSEIDAKKHRFIGMFREPYKASEKVVVCNCGRVLKLYEEYDHWLMGHFDIPQYGSIPTYKNRYTGEDSNRKTRLPEKIINVYSRYAELNMLFGQRIETLDRDSLIAAVGYLLDKMAEERL